jgi:hypothetical protein
MTETDLRWRLRQLPRDIEPGRDLWPGIAASLQRPPARRSRRWLGGLALAASLTLAVGLGWRLTPSPSAPVSSMAVSEKTVSPLQREASAMTREYRAALREYAGAPLPKALSPSLQVLDDSAAQIRAALVAQPGSPALLQQLRKTYFRRLALTRRVLTG